MTHVNIFWFRRDLRLKDNAGLYHALRAESPVIPIFIFDKIILDQLENRSDARVNFIHQSLSEMQQQLELLNSSLEIYYGEPLAIFKKIVSKYIVKKVYTNNDYEPYAIERDQKVKDFLQLCGVEFHSYKDQVIFEKNEITKDDGKPYTVFTPYSRKWKEKLNEFYIRPYPVEKYLQNFYRQPPHPVPSLENIGFNKVNILFPSKNPPDSIIENYAVQRNYPSEYGTSKLGVHLRFGTISIRALVSKATQLDQVFLNELIWREFYQCILFHFPHVGKQKAFKPEYENINWINNEHQFDLWCNGNTGYPIVDAGMRQLNQTGFMHNRVRMIVASFLSKHLLIDWRWGEAYFAEKLLDFDLASNNGGWQWAAGSGCDAAPYFRIFNPYIQTKKFDPSLKYISKWVPEYAELTYPPPMVDHDFARKRCLEVYGNALKKQTRNGL